MLIPIYNLPYMLHIGRQGEKNYTAIEFDLSPWLAEFGAGEVLIVHQRPDGHVRHAARDSLASGSVTWLISAADTDVEGKGRAEIRLYVDEKIVKTAPFITSIYPSIHDQSEGEPYVPQDMTDEIFEALAGKLDKKLSLENVGKMLFVNNDGNIITERAMTNTEIYEILNN